MNVCNMGYNPTGPTEAFHQRKAIIERVNFQSGLRGVSETSIVTLHLIRRPHHGV
jgi:hypothetical protein